MAGLGNRFKIEGYSNIKPLIEVGDKPMIERAIQSLGLKGQFIFIINTKNGQSEELELLLNNITSDPIIIKIDYLTEGPASSCLLAKKFINNETPLIITNCDQIMEWDSINFERFIENTEKDGIVVTYDVLTNKNSYVKLDNFGNALVLKEKEIISNFSLNGIHFWKHGYDFIKSSEEMILKNLRVNNEFYIAPTYNHLINDNKKIGIYHIDKECHWPVGTPEDLKKYLLHANL